MKQAVPNGQKPQPLQFVRGKKRGTNTEKQTPSPEEGSFRRPPLAEFGADAARSFADRTTGVGGMAAPKNKKR